MTTLENLGRLLQEKRGNRGIREIAREIGISHATLSRVERGHLPDLENYQKICRWIGIDVPSLASISSKKEPTAIPQVHFRKPPTVSPKTAQALAQLILTAQKMMSAK